MYETECRFTDESPDPIAAVGPANEAVSRSSSTARRRIEELRELHRLRKLIDDPDFDELS